MSDSFNPQEFTHWLLIVAYLTLSIWVVKKVYFG